MAPKLIYDLTGQRFGRLVVIRKSGGPYGSKWLCQCDCGNRKDIPSRALRSGNTTSCGCYRKETTRNLFTKHLNPVVQPEAGAYRNMILRCYNEKNKAYKDYGGRGIIICDRWRFGENGLSGWDCFMEDMGKKPSPKHSIDRQDNDGDYNPENCRWATHKQQRANQRPRKRKTA